jgi:uncharacterized protein involved in exopolysaccharide biosynthesis
VIESELARVRERLAEVEKALVEYRESTEQAVSPPDQQPDEVKSAQEAPSDFVYAALLREWRFYENLYNTLRSNYETAQIQERHARVDIWQFYRGVSLVQTPAPPAPPAPQKPSAPPKQPAPPKPNHGRNAATGALMGLLTALVMAFFAEYWKKAMANPERAEKIRELCDSSGITRLSKLFRRKKLPPEKS